MKVTWLMAFTFTLTVNRRIILIHTCRPTSAESISCWWRRQLLISTTAGHVILKAERAGRRLDSGSFALDRNEAQIKLTAILKMASNIVTSTCIMISIRKYLHSKCKRFYICTNVWYFSCWSTINKCAWMHTYYFIKIIITIIITIIIIMIILLHNEMGVKLKCSYNNSIYCTRRIYSTGLIIAYITGRSASRYSYLELSSLSASNPTLL